MTVEQIKMPQLGESVTEGVISKWLVSVGDRINKYDPLAEVMTDKVNAEIPSSYTGVIKDLSAEEGKTLTVGEIICTIEVEGEKKLASAKTEAPISESMDLKNSIQNKARFSPAVVKVSQEHHIDLSQVKGSGAGGRITRKDLLTLIASGNAPAVEGRKDQMPVIDQGVENLAAVQGTTEPPSDKAGNGDIRIPVSGVRKTIADNMLRSKHEAPHAWTMIEVDATNLVEYRNSIKNDFMEKEGFNLTFFAFFVKAAAQALKEFPQVNSMWDGDAIIQKKDINLSIAVATQNALYVPVIKNADEKSVKGIARDIVELAGKVRSGKLKPEDLQGGTFTVNNTGTFGSIQSMGILNYPQAAILQVESIVKRPVVVNQNMIAIRDMVNLCLSIDHRILDGLISGRFLQRLKEIIEKTSAATMPIY